MLHCAQVCYLFRWYRSSWPSWSSRGEGTAWSRWYPWTSWSEGRTRLGILWCCVFLGFFFGRLQYAFWHPAFSIPCFSFNYPYTFKLLLWFPSAEWFTKDAVKTPMKHRTRIQSALRFLFPGMAQHRPLFLYSVLPVLLQLRERVDKWHNVFPKHRTPTWNTDVL